MRVAIVFLALVAFVAASGLHDDVAVVGSSLGSLETSYTNQPVVIVRKTTYYEPELVAVVVEKGVDDIPEETFLIQNYADVLGDSNHEIKLCSADNTNACLEKPVTKFLVPSLFQSIGQTGFKKFFDNVKEVPWLTTIDNNVQLVNPILSPKSSADEKPVYETHLDSFKPIKVVPSDVFRYVPDSAASFPINDPYWPAPPSVSTIRQVPTVESCYDVPQGVYYPRQTAVFPSNIQAGFAPLDQITSGRSILGGTTTRTTYQKTPTYFGASYRRRRRDLQLYE